MITLADFSYIQTGLNADTNNVVLTSEPASEQPAAEPASEQPASEPASETGQRNLELENGAHIAGVWSDEAYPTGHTLTWYIGVVEPVGKPLAFQQLVPLRV